MDNLSENYRLRKCFLQRNQVPTQSLIRKKMTPALANVYFKSMTPRLKVLAGLEPPMKGGGNDWIIPPGELLQGRVVLKPFGKKFMSQWRWSGIDDFGMKMIQDYRDRMKTEGIQVIAQNDREWPVKVTEARCEEWKSCAAVAEKANTQCLKEAIHTFEILYTTSVNKLQNVFFDEAWKHITTSRNKLFTKIQTDYADLLQQQSTKLYDKYTKKLTNAKVKLKYKFKRDLELNSKALGEILHDVNVEKYVAIEKLRHLLECQTLACQVYVAMKERKECTKDMEITSRKHEKITKILTEEIKYKNLQIELAQQKEQARLEYESFWQKKVSHVVKKFQTFVSYCLNMLPEHAEFFINMEKLMLLQLGEALEFPQVRSIIIMDVEKFDPVHTPIPEPHPFYLFCDKRNKPKVNQDLCPKHCTSSATQMPVVVVNKRCIYAACDNFEQFTDKIRDYVYDTCEEDAGIDDYHDYSRDVPVKYTASQQLQELKLESSIMQVLQQEIANARKLPIKCAGCNVSHCFDCNNYCRHSTSDTSPLLSEIKKNVDHIQNNTLSQPSIRFGNKIPTGKAELAYEKEPKWESYSKYIKSKKCDCAKMAKKHLLENLPIYMKKMSPYEEPELLNYEKCSVAVLKSLVKNATGKVTPPPPTKVLSKTRDMSTQCDEFDYLCTCLSKCSVLNVLSSITEITYLQPGLSTIDDRFDVIGTSISSTYLTKSKITFAVDRARSLRHLIDKSKEVEEIFMKAK